MQPGERELHLRLHARRPRHPAPGTRHPDACSVRYSNSADLPIPGSPHRTSAPLRPTRRPSNKWSSLPHSLCRSCNTGGTASRSAPVAPRAGASAHSEAIPHPALSQRRRLAPGPGTAKSPNPSWLGLAQEVSLKGMASGVMGLGRLRLVGGSLEDDNAAATKKDTMQVLITGGSGLRGRGIHRDPARAPLLSRAFLSAAR
jgi:hypothetical protein